MTDLIPSVAIDRVIAARTKALQCMEQLLQSVSEVDQAFADAGVAESASRAGAFFSNVLTDCFRYQHGSLSPSARSRLVDTLQRGMDAELWRDTLDRSGIRSHLSAALRDQWSRACAERKTAPFEHDALVGTFGDLIERRAEIMADAVVELFRKLSWDYKTNQPQAFTAIIFVSYFRPNEIDDLDRAMHVLDGEPERDHRVSLGSKLHSYRDCRQQAENDYLHVQCYKKGSARVKFKRADLMDRLNGILASRYPDALPHLRGR